jgi:hypothetical protein
MKEHNPILTGTYAEALIQNNNFVDCTYLLNNYKLTPDI